MAEKALTAILSAQETISESLASVADALEDVAESSGVTGEAMDTTEEAADEVRDAMAETSAVLQEAQEGFEGVGVEARQAAMAEEDFANAGENVRNAQMQMAQANERAEDTLAEEAQTFREAIIGADGLAEAKDAASRANQTLSGTAKATQDALGDEVGAMYRMAQAADTTDEFIDNLINSELALAAVAEQSESELRGMTKAMAANTVAARIDEEALNDLKDSLEETGDEATATALQMAGLSGAFAATSLNLGPFNFALRQAAVQLPQLVAVTGSLTASLGGLATAATTAGGAIAAIYGGGILAMAERMAMVNSEYENTWEAIQGVMEDVRGTFMRALQPLMNQQAVEMFKDGITGLASALNMFAQLVTQIQGDIDEFLGSLSTSFFENANEILMELESTMDTFLPILADFFEWFNEKLPGALEFFRTEGAEFTKALAGFAQQFLDFFRSFSELGIAAFEGILPAIAGVLSALRMVTDILNQLPNEVIALAAGFLVLSRAMSGAVGMGISLGRFFSGLVTSITQARGALGLFNSMLAAFHLTSAQEAVGLLADRLGILDNVFMQSSDAAQTAMRNIESLDLGDEIGDEVTDLPDTVGTQIRNVNSRIETGMASAATTIRTRMTAAWDDATSYIMSTAGQLRTSLPAAFDGALGAVSERFRQFNVDDSFTGDIASDVALGGPRLTRDVPEVQVHTRTGRARQALDSLRSSIAQTGGRMRSFASNAVAAVRTGFESLAARGFGAVSVFTGLGEAVVSAVPGLGNFQRAVGNIQGGLETISPTLGSFINNQIARIPRSMDEANAAALRFTDGLNARMSPYLDAANERLLAFTSSLNSSLQPQLDSANTRMLNFTEALDPNQDLSFYDIFAQKLGVVTDAARSAGASVTESLLNISFEDSGIRNLRTGQFTSFGDAIMDRALGPVRALNSALASGGAMASSFAADVMGVLPTMDSMNESALAAADSVDESISPALDSANDSLLSYTDRINDALLPYLDAANQRFTDFAEVANPSTDLTFYDVVASKFRTLGDAARSAGEAAVGAALDVSFEGAGMRDLQTGQFTSFRQVIGDRLSSAVNTALGPLRLLGGRIRDVAGGFAQSVASIDSYSDAMAAVNRRTTAAINRLRTLAISAGRTVYQAVRRAALGLYNYASAALTAQTTTMGFNLSLKSLAMAPVNALRGLYSLVGGIYTYVTAAITGTLASTGLVHSLALIQAQGIPVISTIAGMAASFIGMAVTEGLATAATYALGTALNVALAGIPALIGLIVVAAGALVGILGNLGGITSGAQAAFDGLKAAGEALFNALLTLGMPVWNLFITLLEVVLAPLFAVWDAFMKLAEGLGLISEGGSAAGGMLSAVGDVLGWLVNITAAFFEVFIAPLNMLADLIYAAIYIPLSLIVDVIVGIIDVIGDAIDWFMNLQVVQKIIDEIQSGVEMLEEGWASLMEVIGSVVDYVRSQVEGMINFIIGLINGYISMINEVPFVDIQKLGDFEFGGGGSGGASERLAGAEASAKEARKNAEDAMADDSKDGQEDMAGGQQTVINTYEQNNYNFGDFEMKPEEKARVKGLVQEAIEEANRTKRLRDGGI